MKIYTRTGDDGTDLYRQAAEEFRNIIHELKPMASVDELIAWIGLLRRADQQ
ncbi:MAG: hypothetical protein MZV63_29325 [Marinilabiliales bacterium]|nr:hypothetical protein [Marinilabiliales bacterium]